jgi:hypothetical protein
MRTSQFNVFQRIRTVVAIPVRRKGNFSVTMKAGSRKVKIGIAAINNVM